MMCAPLRANSSAIALPTRCAAPVTIATWSVSSTCICPACFHCDRPAIITRLGTGFNCVLGTFHHKSALYSLKRRGFFYETQGCIVFGVSRVVGALVECRRVRRVVLPECACHAASRTHYFYSK